MKSYYAYGIIPLTHGNKPQVEWVDCGAKRFEIRREPYAFLHYWVDEDLEYGEEERPTDTPPKDAMWSEDSRFAVVLRGPRDYTITFGGLW